MGSPPLEANDCQPVRIAVLDTGVKNTLRSSVTGYKDFVSDDDDDSNAGPSSWAYGLDIMRLAYESARPDMRELLRVGQLWGAVVKQRGGLAGPWAAAPVVEFRAYLDRLAGDREAEIVRHSLESGMEVLCQLACDELKGGGSSSSGVQCG